MKAATKALIPPDCVGVFTPVAHGEVELKIVPLPKLREIAKRKERA